MGSPQGMYVLLNTFVTFLLISSLLSFIGAVIAWKRSVPGITSLAFMLLFMGLWAGSYAIAWLPFPLQVKTNIPTVTYLGVVAVPSLFLTFALCFANYENVVTKRLMLGLALEPLITMFLVCTNKYHHLIFESMTLQESDGFQWLNFGHGSWYEVNLIYSYIVITIGLLALVAGMARSSPLVKKQYSMILAAALVPWLGNVFAEVFDRSFPFDITPVLFGFSSALFTYSVFRHRFMDIISMARGRLIENMSDGVLVLDANNIIVDINPAMERLLDRDRSSFFGKPASDVLEIWQEQTELIFRGEKTRTELRLPDSPSRYLDLRVTTLLDKQERLHGRLIVFRDVTDRKQVEKKLRQANERLQSQLIEIGTLQSKLRSQAVRDPLTNLFNRRYLDETLDRELARAARENYSVCLIMLDLDHFKKVNDTYGHEAGDFVLKALAETISSRSRRGDFACRYGGEEFVIVMPNIALDTAYQRAEKLRKTLNGLQIPYGNFQLSTTISIGIACYPSNGEDRESLLRAADRAMYAAKKAGRNHILTYDKLEAQHPSMNH